MITCKMVNGFTLIELLIVLAIFASTLTITLPNVDKIIQYYSIRSFAKNVYDLLSLAQSHSQTTHKKLWLHIEHINHDLDLWLLKVTDHEKLHDGTSIMQISHEDFPKIKLHTNYIDNKIIFDPKYGQPSSGCIVFYLTNAPKSKLKIISYFHSGRIRVCSIHTTNEAFGYPPC